MILTGRKYINYHINVRQQRSSMHCNIESCTGIFLPIDFYTLGELPTPMFAQSVAAVTHWNTSFLGVTK